MYLRHVQLNNYRSHAAVSFDFSHRVTAFTGLNGSGKTNLLDAIGYLSMLRSFLSHADQNHVRHGADYFSIKGIFVKQNSFYEVVCCFRTGQGKSVFENGNAYQRLSTHIGKYPSVLIAPQDLELVNGSSEVRRKFFDQVISQTSPTYLQDLLAYQHTLQQRNSLLTRFYETHTWDEDLMETYEEKLADTGSRLVACRQAFMNAFYPALATAYATLAGDEKAGAHYRTELAGQDFLKLLKANRQKDRLLQRTSAGPHRDDYDFLLNGSEIKKTGSQGQQKSFIAALKLAQYQYIKQQTGIVPILLLDDLFDKLDDHRVSRLLQSLGENNLGQIFITDAREDRTRQALARAGLDFEIVRVEKN
ncbi:MAG: DNA replication and repair protein RecF [Cyclobacteriaceae bacterium]|nr:MAG: DNA replication and repair protein RecF [Cyclobacteriaceae bacterium]